MQKIFTLLFFLLLHGVLLASTPTVPSSNMSFNALDGGQLTGNVTTGNGTYRIIVMKQGSPVTGVPQDGVEYTANAALGTAASQFTQPGEYVIGKTSWGSFTPTGLQPGTTYYFAVFEYNGSGSGTRYLNLPLKGNATTTVAPTSPASNLVRAASTGTTMTIGWTPGNGTGRMLVIRKGSAVSFTPADLTNYWSDENFGGSSNRVATDHYIVYKGGNTGTIVKNLEPATTYHFALFEYNGNFSPVFHTASATGSFTTNSGPTTAPSHPSFSWVEGNRMTVNVSPGNGSRRLFIARKGAPVTSVPVNGTTYTASGDFGSGQELNPGEYVVGATTGGGINLTGLEPNTTYHVRAFEYDVNSSGFTYYLTSAYTERAGSTATTPGTIASNLNVTALAGTGATVGFTPGNGLFRMVVMKAGSAVDAVPTDLQLYAPNAAFGSGAQITPGNFVIHSGINGSSFHVTNLVPGTTYHAAIYEYNGNSVPVYSSTAARISFTVPLEPTYAASNPWSALVEGGSFRIIWTNGGGGKRLVVARKGAAVSATPVDGANYIANNVFGSGQEIGAGQFVVFNGTGSEVNLKGLEVGTTYHLAVYEYNTGADGATDYLTASKLVYSASTLPRPTAQLTLNPATAIGATQATINFTKGNGTYRIFIMKKGGPVDVTPQDFVSYNHSTSFGASAAHMGNGNYVVASTSAANAFNITGLQANTTYHLTAYEFNGYSEPAYLLAGASTISFTTADEPGAVVPTITASAPQVSGVEGNALNLQWTNGNGERRIVVMRAGNAVTFTPVSGATYNANASFGAGTDLGDGQFVVYAHNGSSVSLSNLLPATTYHYAVFELSGTGTLIRYGSAFRGTAATAAPPAQPSGSIQTATASGQLTLNWTNGNGTGRLVVLREGATVTATPAAMAQYPASTQFGSGAQVEAGSYVVYAGTGNTVTITGLVNNSRYHYAIFEYNGTTAPVFGAAATGSAVVSSALPVKLQHFTALANGATVALNWATWGEHNTASFIVERKEAGGDFIPVHTTAAAGSATVLIQYNHTDAGLVSGSYQYRLKMMDIDGRFTYSPVQVVTVSAGNGLSVFPNPVINEFRLRLPAGMNNAVMSIYHSSGALVQRQRVKSGETISGATLAKGSYLVDVREGEQKASCVMVKQ